MPEIDVKKNADEGMLARLGVRRWEIWTKEISEFPWSYDCAETCYFLEGKVVVTPSNGGAPVEIGAGDLVTFPRGLECVWRVLEPVRKYYLFEE